MKLPNFRRLLKTDYDSEYSALIETLSFSINTGIEALYSAFNKSINLQDNVACTVKTLEVSVDATGKPKTPTLFQIFGTNKILGMTVLNAINFKNPLILPTAGVFISFYQEGKTINIINIKGLPADEKFTLTVVAFDS